jgi:sigma-B regulation protein RsbU (phosphoserine phosphatase)
VQRAYEELVREGLIVSRNGKGFIVAPLTREQKQAIAQHRLLGKKSSLNVLEAFSRQFIAVFEQKRQMDEELLMAQQIQAGLSPKVLPDNDHLQLAAHSEPSRTVGGDFYDCLPINEHRFGLVIADACGKGVPAAMLISQIQAIVKNEAGHGSSIRRTMINLNHHVMRHTSAKNFATLVYGIFDRRTGIFEFANAGHFYPILARKDGRVEYLKTTGPALGVLAETDYQIETVKCRTGDCLLFYTDGVTETMNGAGEEFGEQRLQETLLRHRGCGAQDIIQAIVAALKSYCSLEHAQDDRTLMVLKVLAQDENWPRGLAS